MKEATAAAPLDFSFGERGKYARRARKGTNVVLLAPDVAKAFPTARAMNAAPRATLRARKKAS